MDIFKLVGSVFIDTNEAQDSLAKVDEKAEKTGINLAGMAGKFGKAALGVGAAAVAAGAAAVGLANNAAAAADEIDKGSLRMGVSTTSYQELRYAAGQCGIEMSTMEKAAKKLEGTDMNFDDAIASIMSLGTEEERSAAAAELFGESVAYQLSPMLAMTGDEFNNLTGRASELGIIMSEDAVAAGVKMGDTMSDVKQSLGAVATEVGSALMPIIQALLDWILQHMPQIQETVGAVINFIMGLIDSLTPLIQAISPIVEGVFNGIIQLWETSLKPMLEGIITFITGVFTGNWEQAWEGVKSIFDGIVNGLETVFKGVINGIISAINRFTSGLGTLKIPDWVPGVGGKELSFPQIPLLAEGGDIVSAGTAIVGEEGPEMLTLPAGAKVQPIKGGLEDKVDRLIDLLETYLPQAGADIVLDSGALVGATVGKYDKAFGGISAGRRRGY